MMINSTPRGDRNSILKSASIMNCLKKPLDPTPAIKSKRDKVIYTLSFNISFQLLFKDFSISYLISKLMCMHMHWKGMI